MADRMQLYQFPKRHNKLAMNLKTSMRLKLGEDSSTSPAEMVRTLAVRGILGVIAERYR
jgi:hypothetical protein